MDIGAKTIKANIFSYKNWINEINPDVLKGTFKEALVKSEFRIVKFDEYYFPEKGYTCFWLLAESHLAIHTFPDDNRAYVELSSCNEKKLKSFVSMVSNLL